MVERLLGTFSWAMAVVVLLMIGGTPTREPLVREIREGSTSVVHTKSPDAKKTVYGPRLEQAAGTR